MLFDEFLVLIPFYQRRISGIKILHNLQFLLPLPLWVVGIDLGVHVVKRDVQLLAHIDHVDRGVLVGRIIFQFLIGCVVLASFELL